jgi:YHS domain-containing protein
MKALFYLVITVLAITFIRSVIGLIMKTMGELMNPSSQSSAQPGPPPSQGGELKKDPVCGVYISTAASVKKTVKGTVVHFCSETCRNKYQG